VLGARKGKNGQHIQRGHIFTTLVFLGVWILLVFGAPSTACGAPVLAALQVSDSQGESAGAHLGRGVDRAFIQPADAGRAYLLHQPQHSGLDS